MWGIGHSFHDLLHPQWHRGTCHSLRDTCPLKWHLYSLSDTHISSASFGAHTSPSVFIVVPTDYLSFSFKMFYSIEITSNFPFITSPSAPIDCLSFKPQNATYWLPPTLPTKCPFCPLLISLRFSFTNFPYFSHTDYLRFCLKNIHSVPCRLPEILPQKLLSGP